MAVSRDRTLQVLLRPDEYAWFAARAAAEHTTMSALARQMILRDKPAINPQTGKPYTAEQTAAYYKFLQEKIAGGERLSEKQLVFFDAYTRSMKGK